MKNLKKFLCATTAAMIAVSSLSGCKGGSDDSVSVYSSDMILSSLDYNVSDCVKLCDLSSLDVSEIERQDITDDYMNNYIDYYLQSYPNYEKLKKKNVGSNDTVKIDYTAKVDGKNYEGGSDSNYYLTIGSKSDEIVDGFGEGLIGAKVGSNVSLDLVYPDDYYDEDYAGKNVTFDVKIKGIYKATAVTHKNLTDEFAKEYLGYDTVEDFNEYIKTYLNTSNEYDYESSVSQSIMDQIRDNSTITIPDSLLDAKVRDYLAQINKTAKEEGKALEEYVQDTLKYETMDEYKDDITGYVKETLENDLVAQELIKEKNYSVAKEEFDEFVQKTVERGYFENEDEFYKEYGSREDALLAYCESEVMSDLTDEVIKQAESQANVAPNSEVSGENSQESEKDKTFEKSEKSAKNN